jgi:hypothetical protein
VERIVQMKGRLLLITVVFGLLSIGEYIVADYLNGDVWVGPTFSGITRNVYILGFILFVIATNEASFPFSDTFSDIGAKSLGIYMANIPAIYVTAVLLYRLMPWTLGMQLIYQAILFVAGLGGPLLLMWLVRQTPVRVGYRYLFG